VDVCRCPNATLAPPALPAMPPAGPTVVPADCLLPELAALPPPVPAPLPALLPALPAAAAAAAAAVCEAPALGEGLARVAVEPAGDTPGKACRRCTISRAEGRREGRVSKHSSMRFLTAAGHSWGTLYRKQTKWRAAGQGGWAEEAGRQRRHRLRGRGLT
jgi:hypothetical protein